MRIDTSTDSGSELDGARFLAAKLEAAGIPVHIEQLGDNQANLWAILEGEDPRALVLHNHIDVYIVEDPDKWDFPPFGGVIEPPYLYGRGAFDMKSIAIAQLEALLAVARSGKKPKRSIIFLATGSEEIGSELGTRRILDQHPELASRFWAVLTEGGIIEPLELEDIKYWGIEFAQKQFASAYACSASRERLQELREEILAGRDSVADLRLTPAADSLCGGLRPLTDPGGLSPPPVRSPGDNPATCRVSPAPQVLAGAVPRRAHRFSRRRGPGRGLSHAPLLPSACRFRPRRGPPEASSRLDDARRGAGDRGPPGHLQRRARSTMWSTGPSTTP